MKKEISNIRKKGDKLFVVRKYIYAKSASEALSKEGRFRSDDVWIDDDWKKSQGNELPPAMGFLHNNQDG